MKVLISGEAEEKEKIVRLKLMRTNSGVSVVVTNENGDRVGGGSLMTFNSKGATIHTSVLSSLGVPLDQRGRIIINKEGE